MKYINLQNYIPYIIIIYFTILTYQFYYSIRNHEQYLLSYRYDFLKQHGVPLSKTIIIIIDYWVLVYISFQFYIYSTATGLHIIKSDLSEW